MIINSPKKNGVQYFADNTIYLRADDTTVARYMTERYPTYVLDSYVTETRQRFSNDGQLYHAYYEGGEWKYEFSFSKVVTSLKILVTADVTSGSTITVTEDTQFNYLGETGTTATVVIDGVSFIISNSGGNFVWDLGGLGEYNFGSGTTGSISVTVNGKLYTINFTRGSLLFSIVEVGNSPDYFTLPDGVTFSYNSGITTSFLVNTNLPWSLTENIDWLTLDKNYGTGKTDVVGTVIYNGDNITKTGLTYVTVDSGSIHEVKSLLMTQEAEPDYINVNKTDLTFSYSSGLTDNFVISTNLDWVLSESIDWIQFDTYSGSGNTTVTGTIVSGNTTAVRSGLTTITTSLGVINLVINQGYFNVSSTGLTFTSTSGSTNLLTINTNLSWTLSESIDWIQFNNYSGVGTTIVTGTAVSGNTGSVRTGLTSIVVDGITTSILITQSAPPPPPPIILVTSYQMNTLAINEIGQAWGWGDNTKGKLGDNSIVNKSTPVAVCGSHTFTTISIGSTHSLAIDNLGQTWSWGSNSRGILGDNTIVNKSTPVAVCGSHTFTKISAGADFSLAIDNLGMAWSWGGNDEGRLGNSGLTTQSQSIPVAVCGNHTFTTISTGWQHSLAIDNLGMVWGWGNNYNGCLGINSIVVGTSIPVAVCGGHTFTAICGGNNSSIAIDNLGQAWGWGSNYKGKLGDNSTVNQSTPVAVCGGHTFTTISTGYAHSMAIDNLGQAWGWGYNVFGALGDNTTTSKLTPVAVCGGHTFTTITVGQYHTVAVDTSGRVWAWGYNTTGQLGNNSTVNKSTPVAVCNI